VAWLPKNNVVVPIDFSGQSVGAINTALELVEDASNVHVIHVVVPLGLTAPDMEWGGMDDEVRAESVRKHFGEFLAKHSISGVTTVVRLGDPGLEITAYAKECHADLIVVPSHGYHGFKRFLLGSVAERVIRHADCPVLVLRRADEG
jgi:nucleotide-binding universal stress UspA family protein